MGVGNSSPQRLADIGYNTLAAATPALRISKTNAVNNRLLEGYDAATRGYVRINSSQTNLEFEASSDRRIKENFKPMDSTLSNICEIELKKYDYKDGRKGKGPIAQDLIKIFPDKVTSTDDGQGAELPYNVEPWTITNDFTWEIMKAIQEQQTQIENLKAEIAAIKEAIK